MYMEVKFIFSLCLTPQRPTICPVAMRTLLCKHISLIPVWLA